MDLDTVTRHLIVRTGLAFLDLLDLGRFSKGSWFWFFSDLGFGFFLQDVGFLFGLFQNSKNKKLMIRISNRFGFFGIGFKKIQYLDGWFIWDDIEFTIELNQSTSETKIVVKPLAV